MARHGKARQGKARQGKANQSRGKASKYNVIALFFLGGFLSLLFFLGSGDGFVRHKLGPPGVLRELESRVDVVAHDKVVQPHALTTRTDKRAAEARPITYRRGHWATIVSLHFNSYREHVNQAMSDLPHDSKQPIPAAPPLTTASNTEGGKNDGPRLILVTKQKLRHGFHTKRAITKVGWGAQNTDNITAHAGRHNMRRNQPKGCRRIFQGSSRVMTPPLGRVRNKSKYHGSGRVESVRFGSVRVRSADFQTLTDRVGSGRVSHPYPTQPDPRGLTRPMNSPVISFIANTAKNP